jgi:hypothetical protein
MKPFLVWLAIVILVFGGLGGGYHAMLLQNPRKVLVAVDSSFQMKSAWSRVPNLLDSLDNDRYTVYTLVTEKNPIHSWKSTLNLGALVPYAPLDLAKLTGPEKYPEIEQAAQKYLITTDQTLSSNPDFKEWTIIQLAQ